MAQWEVLDISEWQSSTMKYDQVITSVSGVLMRIGYRGYGQAGTLVKDKMLETHYAGFKGKTKIGFYWFPQAITEEESKAEADFCHSILNGKQCDFPVYYDSEWSNTSHNGRADGLTKNERTYLLLIWAARMQAYGYRVGVYASDNWYKVHLNLSQLQDAGLSIWVAKYSAYKPSYVPIYDGWQYTSNGTVAGYSDRVDLSHFYNNVAGWEDSTQIDISDMTISLDPEVVVYYGGVQKPTASIAGLTLNVDFTSSYSNNINAGYGICTCNGINNYTGTTTRKFLIDTQSLALYGHQITLAKNSYEYDGNAVIPEYSIAGLTAGIDYTILCENNTRPGVATIYATGIGNYRDTISTTYTIYTNTDINDKTIVITPDQYNYDGTEKRPSISITGLTIGADYTVEYENNINAGTGRVIITGAGIYTGTQTKTFTINPVNITSKSLTLSLDEFTYDGEPKCPEVYIDPLIKDIDYIVTYKNNINAGNAIATVTGTGNYIGSLSKSYKIFPASISTMTLGLIPDSMVYTGDELFPDPVINGLILDTDYTVAYSNNINVGEGIVIATGKGNYTDNIYAQFTIIPASISTMTIKFNPSSIIYTGLPITPEPIIEGLILNSDYYVTYQDNVNIGIGKGIATGMGNYTDTTEGNFTITTSTIEDYSLIVDEEEYVFDGSAHIPNAHIDELELNVDYTIEYSDNVNAGTASVIARGIGNYAGVIVEHFTILPMNISGYTMTIYPEEFAYNRRQQVPSATVVGLTEGIDYSVSGRDNIDVGVATCICTGMGNYTGTIEMPFLILPANIATETIRVNPLIVYYDGGPKCPEVTIENLTINKDFTTDYTNNINVGNGFVTITGKGNYEGEVKKPFTILPLNIEDNYEIDEIPDQYYKGICEPEIHIDGCDLVLDQDYTLHYENNDKVGIATVIVTGINNYSGIITRDFNIIKTPITLATVKLGTPTLYSHYRVNGDLSIIYDGYHLERDIDYSISGWIEEEFDNFTLITFIASGINEFIDSRVYRFRVIDEEPTPPSGEDEGIYNFGNIDPNAGPGEQETAVGNYDFGDLDDGIDNESIANGDYDFEEFSINYMDLYDADDGTNIDSYGRRKYEDPNYIDETLININSASMGLPETNFVYNFGKPIKPEFITELVENIDYEVSYVDNINIGVATITVYGIGNYTGLRVFNFIIDKRNFTEDGIIDCGDPDSKGYYDINNRRVYVPDERDLVLNTEYTEEIEEYANLETGIVYNRMTVRGIGNFIGTISSDIPVDSIIEDIKFYTFTILEPVYIYTGDVITPIPVSDSLTYLTDYIVSGYDNNVDAGTATVNLKGIGNYRGETSVNFTIIPKSIKEAKIAIGEIVDESYDHDSVRVIMPNDYELDKETEVDISFHDYSLGELKISDITATGKGNYTKSVTKRFYLNDSFLDISETDVDVTYKTHVYTGLVIHPEISSQDRIYGIDYDIQYDDNAINVGDWTTTIIGIGNYTDSTKILTFTITHQPMSMCTIVCGDPDESGYYNPENLKVYNKNGDLIQENIDYRIGSTEIWPDFEFNTKNITFEIIGINNYNETVTATFPIDNLDPEDYPINPETIDEIQAKVPINLFEAPVYARSTSKLHDTLLTGIYLIYDNKIKNNRVRVVKSYHAFENPCMITGWVDLEYILKKNDIFVLKDKVLVNGTLYQYEDGTGVQMEKQDEVMYITYINEDPEHGQYNYGLSSELYTVIQGYCDTSILKHTF